MTDLQTEKAFQKQDGVFLAKKLIAKKSSTGVRYYKKVGLGKSKSQSDLVDNIFCYKWSVKRAFGQLIQFCLYRLQDPIDCY